MTSCAPNATPRARAPFLRARLLPAVVILHRSAQVDMRSDSDGATPLHRACECGDIECARLLIEDAGADIDAVDVNGNTPVHTAFAFAHTDLAAYMLGHGGASSPRASEGAGCVVLGAWCWVLAPGCWVLGA